MKVGKGAEQVYSKGTFSQNKAFEKAEVRQVKTRRLPTEKKLYLKVHGDPEFIKVTSITAFKWILNIRQEQK